MDYKAALLQLLDLTDTASDADITAALAEVEKEMSSTPEAEKPTDLSAVNLRIDKVEKNNLIALAATQGKVIALTPEAIDKLSVSDLSAHIAQVQPTVPLKALTPGTVKEEDKIVPLSAEEKDVCKTLGITEEAYRKANA